MTSDEDGVGQGFEGHPGGLKGQCKILFIYIFSEEQLFPVLRGPDLPGDRPLRDTTRLDVLEGD